MIHAKGLCKAFDENSGPVLEDISFSLSAGETLSIIGPSGCGKTTLLYMLADLSQPTSGSIAIGSTQGDRASCTTSIILQNFGLFPWKTVSENVALALKIRKAPKTVVASVTASLLEELGIGTLASRYPVQISGGQQQRVAIARALATDPDILLMDEPFSALDAMTREHLQNTLLAMWQKRRLTYVIVTHSVEEAVFLGRTIMILSDRPTRIRKVITNEGFGSQALRMEDQYFEMVRSIRRIMEG
ncbi:putative ABC transporter, ATP-binding protein [Desulfosarcina variabilis str. Montpellier]|uniref:ABC transporter ATP-binding protein n=1 Tax=Desulfosarcina variabilis TaxID=2300 RepID=UPI003AFADCBC